MSEGWTSGWRSLVISLATIRMLFLVNGIWSWPSLFTVSLVVFAFLLLFPPLAAHSLVLPLLMASFCLLPDISEKDIMSLLLLARSDLEALSPVLLQTELHPHSLLLLWWHRIQGLITDHIFLHFTLRCFASICTAECSNYCSPVKILLPAPFILPL